MMPWLRAASSQGGSSAGRWWLCHVLIITLPVCKPSRLKGPPRSKPHRELGPLSAECLPSSAQCLLRQSMWVDVGSPLPHRCAAWLSQKSERGPIDRLTEEWFANATFKKKILNSLPSPQAWTALSRDCKGIGPFATVRIPSRCTRGPLMSG